MNLVTQADFARMNNVSRAAIADAIKRKVFPVVRDGKKWKIDLSNIEVQSYMNGNRQRSQVYGDPEIKGNIKDKPKKEKQTAEKKVTSNAEKNREMPVRPEETVLEDVPETLKEMSKYDLDRMRLAVNIQKEKLKHDKERQLVIDRTVIHKAFNELYQIDREELLQASSHLSPRICQDVFGTNDPEKMTKTTEILDAEFYKIQGHVQKIFDKYLDKWAPISE